MISDNQPSQESQQPERARWHFFLHVYARVNRFTHHLFSLSVKLLVVLYLLFCLLFLLLRYVFLPQIGDYKTDIEHMIGASLGRSVSIAQISSSWDGLRPQLELKQVEIRDEQGNNAVMLPRVEATLGWLSLLIADVRLYRLEIDQPELELKRNADGKIYIAGWWLDPTKETDSRGLNWLLSQRAIVIKNGMLHWTDELRKAPVLKLAHVNFSMRNRWQRHQFSLTATPPSNLAGPIDIRADFKHHPFSENISDYLQWKGLLYADVSKTDLAAWKSYVDYPFDVSQGLGGVRVWFTFDRARIADFTADLKLIDVKAWLRKDLQPLDLLGVSGRISVQEIILPTKTDAVQSSLADRLRENGHQIALTNFSFETRGGMRLPPTTLTERFIPAHPTSAEQLQVSAKFLDLNVLVNLMTHFPLPKEYSELIKDVEPAGQVSDVSVKLVGTYPRLTRYQVAGKFSDLAMQPQAIDAFSALPGFKHLTGKIDVNERTGAVQLASKNLHLFFPENEMKFDSVDMQANWQLHKNNEVKFTLGKFDVKQPALRAQFYGTHTFSTQKSASMRENVLDGVMDMSGLISYFDVQQLNRYLPREMDAELRHWLTQGLMQGKLENVSVHVKGDLTDFPFVKKGLLDQNIFNVTGKIIDGKINYLPGVFGKDGVAPYWPTLNKIQGKIVFDRQTMDIDAESGETDGVSVSNVHARIPDLLSSKRTLEIDGTAEGAGQSMLHYVSVSPVLGWIDNFTEDTKISGSTKLTLHLAIPLSRPLETKVTGEVQLNGNDVTLLEELPLITQVKGQLNFNEHGLNLNTMKGSFLGGPVSVVGGTQKDGVIRIKAEGQITGAGLRKAYPQPELKNILARVDGTTTYSSVVQVNNKRTEVWVDSNLQGMAINLPAPINKAAHEPLRLRFELSNLQGNTAKGTPENDEIKLSLGNAVNARYLREKQSDTSPWIVKRGGIGINAPAPTPDNGVAAHVEVASLNMDDLQAFLPSGRTPTETKAAKQEFYHYFEPNLFSAHVVELTLLGKKLNEVVVGATKLDGVWQANIDSKQISGYLTWDKVDRGAGHVTARLGSLTIPETAANDVVDLLKNENIHSHIPGLDLIADNVELFGKKLGRLELKAQNVKLKNEANANEWQIDTLRLANPDAELTASGKWINGGPDQRHAASNSHTDLDYQLTITSAGKLLDRLGYANLIAGGKGKLSGEVSWAGSPYSMDIPSLSGKVQMDMQSGQFLKVEPGAAKLLAVLNLQALPRRLILDFRDVFSNGFAFDSMKGDADIEHGVVKTDNLKMHSVTATVLMSGTANIMNETQDLNVIVVPEVNAGAASVVYGLAVNPVIGVGTFLAQLFLRKPLMKAFTFEYRVTGPWKEPNVVKIENKVENKEKKSEALQP